MLVIKVKIRLILAIFSECKVISSLKFFVCGRRCIITGTNPNKVEKAKVAVEWVIKKIKWGQDTRKEDFYRTLEDGLKKWPVSGPFEKVMLCQYCSMPMASCILAGCRVWDTPTLWEPTCETSALQDLKHYKM